MTPPRLTLFPKPYARELLNIAGGDLESANTLAVGAGRAENVIFLAQQAVEKSLKAVLVHLQVAFPLVHDLGVLLALLPANRMPPDGFALLELSPYASVRRYEEGRLPLTTIELADAIAVGRRVIAWAEIQLSQ